jgi:hypothetical protein
MYRELSPPDGLPERQRPQSDSTQQTFTSTLLRCTSLRHLEGPSFGKQATENRGALYASLGSMKDSDFPDGATGGSPRCYIWAWVEPSSYCPHASLRECENMNSLGSDTGLWSRRQ